MATDHPAAAREPDRDPSRRSDGARTHAAILDAAMRLASVEGLASLTTGRLTAELHTAVHHGQLAPDTDTTQLAFKLYTPLELANDLATLERDPQILDRARTMIRTRLEAAAGLAA